MKKRVICLIICLSLIIPLIYSIISYAANTDVSFSVKSMNAKRGDQITTVVNMNCTTSFSAGNFVLNYDSAVLEYVPYKDEDNEIDYNQNCGSTILNSSGIPIGTVVINSDTAGTLKVGYMSTKSVAGKNGEFLKFKFNVKNNVTYGNSNITMTATTLKDSNGTNLNPVFTNGVVSILSGITMNKNSVEMIVGDEDSLSVTSSNGTIFENVTWTSNNTGVVSVAPKTDTKEAKITAVSAGTATITATVGGVSATCSVTVTEPEEEYSISITTPAWTFLPVSQHRTISAVFNPKTSSEGKTITWSSSNTNVATISSRGEITAKSEGTTVITASDGNKSATYTLTVSGLLGDIDKDKSITSYDAYRALVLSANQNNGGSVNANEVVVLDVERNGSMSANDAYLILKHSVGLISSFN